MEHKIEYCRSNAWHSPFNGDEGKMTVRNSMEGVLITHEKEFYESQHWSLGKKVVADICNSLRDTYDPHLSPHYSNEDKKKFNKFLDKEIERVEKRLNTLKFAKTILSRKKVIFKRKGADDE